MIVVAQDGIRIRVWDPTPGEQVLLIPDWLASGRFFEGLRAEIESAVLAPLLYDPRGCGRSDRPDYGYSLSRDAEDAALVIEEVLGASAFVAGHGYGARVALRLALLRPELVRGVVLMAPAMPGARAESWAEALEDARRLSDLVRNACTRQVAPGDLAMLARDMAQTTRAAGRAQLAAMREEVGVLPSVLPVAVVAGEFDTWAPIGIVRRVLQDRAEGQFRLLPACGHYLAWEDPTGVAAALSRAILGGPPTHAEAVKALGQDERGEPRDADRSLIIVDPATGGDEDRDGNSRWHGGADAYGPEEAEWPGLGGLGPDGFLDPPGTR